LKGAEVGGAAVVGALGVARRDAAFGLGAAGAPRTEAGRARARGAFNVAVVSIIVIIMGTLLEPRFFIGPVGVLPSLSLAAGSSSAESVHAVAMAADGLGGAYGESFFVASVARENVEGFTQTVRVIARPLLGAVFEATVGTAANAGLWAVELGQLHRHDGDFAAHVTRFVLSTMVARWPPAMPVRAPDEIDRGPGGPARWEQALVAAAVAAIQAWEPAASGAARGVEALREPKTLLRPSAPGAPRDGGERSSR
jgi:hypothetical protein